MAHQWLLWLSYLLLFTADEICVAGIENPSHTPGSAAENADRSPNLTGFPDGSSSNKPAYCNGSRSWFEFKASRIVPNCRAADFLLKSSQIWPRGHTKYEFIPSGVPSQLKFSVIRTPLVVTSGAFWPCSIAIVNLNSVPASFLIGGGTRGPYPISDVATYQDIQNALFEVWSDCVYGIERRVGWAVTGKSNSLGVFMFGTRSDIGKAISPGILTDLLDAGIENVTRLDTEY